VVKFLNFVFELFNFLGQVFVSFTSDDVSNPGTDFKFQPDIVLCVVSIFIEILGNPELITIKTSWNTND
jgi:hypothetical protein